MFEEICSAEVLASSGQAEISFGATVPLLQPDDVLSLGAQVGCSASSTAAGMCSVEDEEELRGTGGCRNRQDGGQIRRLIVYFGTMIS